MAIAEMSRMKLVGVKSEQEKIMASLHRTCAIQIISENISPEEQLKSGFADKFDRLNFACNFLFTNINRIAKEEKNVNPVKEQVYPVTYDEFINALSLEKELEPVISEVEVLNDRIMDEKAKISVLKNELNGYKPFVGMDVKFSKFAGTKKTSVFLGTLKTSAAETFMEEDNPCSAYIEHQEAGVTVMSVVCLKSDENAVTSALSAAGFVRANFTGDFTAKEKTEELLARIQAENAQLAEIDMRIRELSSHIREMKVLLDRYSFEMEKEKNAASFAKTDSTYLLEAFVPTEAVARVEDALKETSDKVFTEFTVVPRDQFAPTLMKNKKVTKQFEFVTNLFSPPSYGSVDHNFVMMLFFSVFMGFIMADMGYGLIMFVGGLVLAKKIGRDTGTARLANVIAVGGIFTFIFGLLFDSFFGYGLLRGIGILESTIMPDPIGEKTVVAGISVPTLLLICLGMGVLQIIASLLLNAAASFSRGKIFDGICDGVVWALFLVGLLLVVIDLGGFASGLLMPAVILMGVSVLFGALTAGRHEKGFGKFTKGFSSVYGLINYMSDILSYARLYGLMLSGAQIATIVTTMAVPMMNSVGGAIMGVIILLIGHAFNLAMGVLGAYIHDSRLQYIEFFGRFYQGEGELFRPFGTTFANTYFADVKQ